MTKSNVTVNYDRHNLDHAYEKFRIVRGNAQHVTIWHFWVERDSDRARMGGADLVENHAILLGKSLSFRKRQFDFYEKFIGQGTVCSPDLINSLLNGSNLRLKHPRSAKYGRRSHG